MITDIYTPAEAKKRLERASHGRKQITLGLNYRSTHGALALAMRPKLEPSLAELPALDLAAMRAIEGGFHG